MGEVICGRELAGAGARGQAELRVGDGVRGEPATVR